MPQIYQTYVSQISNNESGETLTLKMLEQFSPVAVEMSKMALDGEQTFARLSVAVSEITQRALATKKPIVIEKLDFSDKKKQFKLGRKYRRMLSGFAYAKFFELLRARCLKLGIRVSKEIKIFFSRRTDLEKMRLLQIP